MKLKQLMILSTILIGIAVISILPFAVSLFASGELSLGIGMMGLYLALLAIGFSVLATAMSIHFGTEHHKEFSNKINANARKLNTMKRVQQKQYNDLSDKLDNTASQLGELIAIVKSSPQHSPAEDPNPEPLPASTEPSEDAADR